MLLLTSNTMDVTATGTSEPSSTIQVFVGPADGSGLIGTTTTDASGNWGLDLGHLLDSDEPITVVATDLAGNVGTLSVPFADAEPLFYAQGTSGSPVSGSGALQVPWQADGISTVYVNASASSAYLQADGYGDLNLQLIGDTDDDLELADDLSYSSGVESGVQNIVFSDGTVLNLEALLTFTWFGASNNYDLTGNTWGTNIFDITQAQTARSRLATPPGSAEPISLTMRREPVWRPST